jgi:hypothetical protein
MTAVVCGCDGITYLNACLAHADGVSTPQLSIGGDGGCSPASAATVTCTQADDEACTKHSDGSPRVGGKCGMLAPIADVTCAAPTAVCWVVPASCPGQDMNTEVSCANAKACGSVCDAVTTQAPYRQGGCGVVMP